MSKELVNGDIQLKDADVRDVYEWLCVHAEQWETINPKSAEWLSKIASDLHDWIY